MSIFRPERRDVSAPNFLDPNRVPQNGDVSWWSGSRRVEGTAGLYHWPVYACVRKIADTIATLPVDLITNGEPLGVLPSKLVSPASYVSLNEWLHQVMMSLLLHGNAYGIVASTDRLGYPSQVELVDPTRVHVRREDGRKVFVVNGTIMENVWHIAGPALPGELVGMSPLRFAARTVSVGLDAEQFGSDYFRNGIHPSAVLETEQLVANDVADVVKRRIKTAQQNRDAVVLGSGLKLKPWTINAEESQFLETLRHNVVSIAAVYGVPPEMIGGTVSGSAVTYANREQRAQDYLNNAINPWLVRLEDALSGWFPRGSWVKFNTGALLRSDLKTRFEAYQIATGGKAWMLPSEARDLENWVTVAGIDDVAANESQVMG